MDWSGDMADKIGTDEYGEILIYQTDDGQTNIEVEACILSCSIYSG